MIDPSACLVYTVCACLRPEQTLTFHTQGSSPSLSRIIVQLKSQSEPIMWEGLRWWQRRKKKHPGLCEWGRWGKRDVFFWCSSPYSFIAPGGGLIYGRRRVWETEAALFSHRLMNQLLRWSHDPQLTSVNSGVQRLCLKLVSNPYFNIIEGRCKLALYWQETGHSCVRSGFVWDVLCLRNLKVQGLSPPTFSSWGLDVFWFRLLK